MDTTSSIRTILAAVGQLPQDEAVLARAVELAIAHRAALTLAHFLDVAEWDALMGDPALIRQQAERDARDRIAGALARQDAGATEATILIEDGPPSLRLIDLCEDLGADLIVMRAHERDSIAEKIIGSTTDRVIRAATAPVLVVKRPVANPYRRVLLATDGSSDAPVALSFVADLLPDASVQLVQVVEIVPQLEEAMLRVGTDQAALARHRDALARSARDSLSALAATPAGRAARVTTRVLAGAPATALVRATHSRNVDLIALGPGRASLMRRAFIGSVTRRVLHDAACDVLICRPAQPGK